MLDLVGVMTKRFFWKMHSLLSFGARAWYFGRRGMITFNTFLAIDLCMLVGTALSTLFCILDGFFW